MKGACSDFSPVTTACCGAAPRAARGALGVPVLNSHPPLMPAVALLRGQHGAPSECRRCVRSRLPPAALRACPCAPPDRVDRSYKRNIVLNRDLLKYKHHITCAVTWTPAGAGPRRTGRRRSW